MAVQQLQHTHGTTVVPSDTLYLFQSLGYPYRVSSALFVGVGGSVRVLTEGGDDVVFSSVPDGTFMPVHVVKVFATGTTASSIVAVDLSNLSPYSYLLDAYSGAAAAYSLRQLSSSYSGSAIRVRRSSDNTEQDIGFASNELDATALASFCSGTDGFVTTWYDQSGNSRNATQTTAANQPKIYDSSTGVITDNGKPSVQFDGSNDQMTIGYFNYFSTGISQIFSSVVCNNTNSASVTSFVFSHSNETGSPSDRTFVASYYRSNNMFSGAFSTNGTSNSINSFDTWSANSQFNLSTIWDTNNATQSNRVVVYNNGTSNYDSTSVASSGDLYNSNGINLTISGNNAGIALFTGKIQEILFYASDQSSNRTGIETNINGFYSIY